MINIIKLIFFVLFVVPLLFIKDIFEQGIEYYKIIKDEIKRL